MKVWLYTIISTILVSLISFVGVFALAIKKEFLQKILFFLISFAVGALFGDAFLHLLPEAFEELGVNVFTSSLAIVGILIFFVLEKFLRWRHCHIPTSTEHLHPIARLNLIGDSLHNFIDGMIIASSFSVDIKIGLATTVAIILHEIPQEIGDFGVLIYGGFLPKKALFFNFISALFAILGAIASLLSGFYLKNFSNILLPIAAGGFLYIAGSDLLPQLHKSCEIKFKPAILQFIFLLSGIFVMFLLTFLE
ncbi:MAG: ZIP family metal transporter [Candidatus Omnitrophica bacterium]|nr:ZIP family metal transporter [Candidatus Omnitrophota bacterium]